MATLAFAVHGLRSALNNTAALAGQLVRRGHDVTFLSFRDIRADVEHVGARFVLLADGQHAIDRLARVRSERGDVRSWRESRRLRHQLLTLDEPRRALRELDPDLTIIDMEMHGVVLAAHQLNLNALLTLSWHDPMRAPTRPPMHRDMAGPGSRREVVEVQFAWLQLVAARRLRQMAGPFYKRAALARVLPQQLNTPDLGSIRAMARNLAIDLGAITSRHEWVNPHLYVHLPTMSYTARELEFDQMSAPGVIHVGPIIDPDRYSRPLASNVLKAIERFCDRDGDPSIRIAYCSMGSLQPSNLNYYQKVVDAFADDPNWRLILGLGSRGEGLELQCNDDRVLVLSDAPQLQILRACDVAIHPGGVSTFYECLYCEVPSIVMHTGHTDMPGIAARTKHFGLGVVRDRTEVPARQILRDAKELAAGSCAQALRRFKQVIADYDERSPAVDLVERLATQP